MKVQYTNLRAEVPFQPMFNLMLSVHVPIHWTAWAVPQRSVPEKHGRHAAVSAADPLKLQRGTEETHHQGLLWFPPDGQSNNSIVKLMPIGKTDYLSRLETLFVF